MKAARINQPGQMEMIDIPVPVPAENEVVVRVMASGICGTDIHIFRGEYLGSYPVIPGHEFAGVVEKVGSLVTRYQPGDRVAVEPNISCNNCVNCLNNRQNFCAHWQGVGVTRPGGMAQYVVVPENAAFDIGDLPFEQGAFVEPLSCVIHGMQRLDMGLADHAAILGAGPIGLLILKIARLQGARRVVMVDKNPRRAEFALQTGADEVFTSLDSLPQDEFDVVIDASGALPVMARTLNYVRYGGKVLLFGVPPAGKEMSIEAFKIFRKGLTILSSYTSVRNSYQAVELLKSGRVAVDDLVSHRLPLDQFQKGIETIEKGQDNVKKVLILPNG